MLKVTEDYLRVHFRIENLMNKTWKIHVPELELAAQNRRWLCWSVEIKIHNRKQCNTFIRTNKKYQWAFEFYSTLHQAKQKTGWGWRFSEDTPMLSQTKVPDQFDCSYKAVLRKEAKKIIVPLIFWKQSTEDNLVQPSVLKFTVSFPGEKECYSFFLLSICLMQSSVVLENLLLSTRFLLVWH